MCVNLENWIEVNEITKTKNEFARSLDIHHKYTDRLKNHRNDKQIAR